MLARALLRSLRATALLFVLAAPLAVHVPPARADASCRPRAECCKVCDKGKACGNSCISRAKNCHKGRGCACDSDELCD